MAGLQLRVLDLSSGIPGPYCARLLAEYGADVIKVESPEGDWTRRDGVVRGDISALYAYLNENKRGVSLDLQTSSGSAALKHMVERVDVLVESFAPGTMDRLGLGYQELVAINPRIVMVSVTDFGQTGPYKDHQASHLTLSASAGWMGGVGYPDREPVQQGFPVFHYMAGVNGAIGALTAVRGVRQNGRGQHVDLSVFETCWVLGQSNMSVSYGTSMPRRMKQVPDFVRAKDGWVGITAGNGDQWRNTWILAGMLDVLDDPELIYDQVKREKRRPELESRLNDWGKDKTREEIFYAAEDLRIGAGITYAPGETLGCPHLVAREFFVKTSHPKLGEFSQPGAPFKSPAVTPVHKPALGLDEHNDEDLAEFGVNPKGQKKSPPALSHKGELSKSSLSKNGDRNLLAGVRIADLTHWWSGASCTCLMGALGADVIKIESIQRPDQYRYVNTGGKTNPNWFERGFLWNTTNLSKRGITLDLTSEKGKALFLEIVKKSDAVVENFSPRVMRHLGLEYAKLREVNPKIIMLSMSCFGQTGPWRDLAGYGPNFEMISGSSFLTGYRDDGPPVRTALPDPVAGLNGAFALLLALDERDLTGNGQYIDISQIETAATFLGKQVIEYQLNGQTPVRMGNRHVVFAPHNTYPCKGEDQWVAIAVTSDDQWTRLAKLVGKPEWAADPRFATAQARKKIEDEIDKPIAEWTRGQDKRAVMDLLQSQGIAAGAVQQGRDLIEDPHLRARNAFKKLAREFVGEHEYPQPPLHFSDATCEHRRAAPTMGQHTEEVLSELLGLSTQEIEQLRAEKIIGNRPLGL